MKTIFEWLIQFLGLTDENANVYAAIIAVIGVGVTIIGAAIAWWTIRDNRKSQREGHELLHQPSFQIVDFATEKQIGHDDTENSKQLSAPRTCCNPDCTKIHWLNIINKNGCFAATDIMVGLFIIDENEKIVYNDQNWANRNYLASGDSMQYSLPVDNILFGRYFDHGREKQYRFALLLDYKSEFSRQRYKRVYYIDGASQDKTRQDSASWVDAIYFFGTQEYCKTSKKTASKRARLVSFVHKLLRLDFSINDWLNDFSKKGRKYE